MLAFPALQCQGFSGISLGTEDLHIFHLVTMAHIIQILLTSGTGNSGPSVGFLKEALELSQFENVYMLEEKLFG